MNDDHHDLMEPDLYRLKPEQNDRSPCDVERQVGNISVRSSLEQLCAALDAAEWLYARAKSIQYLARQRTIVWIEQHGEFDIGNIHYSVGFSTTVRCLDTRQCGHALLEALGGDFDGYMAMLVAQPYKHGSVGKTLPKPLYKSLFEVKRTGRLINGVPERTLKRLDTRFVSVSE